MRRNSLLRVESFVHLFIIACHFARITLDPALIKLQCKHYQNWFEIRISRRLSHLVIILLSPVLMDKALFKASKRVFSSNFMMTIITISLANNRAPSWKLLYLISLIRSPPALQCWHSVIWRDLLRCSLSKRILIGFLRFSHGQSRSVQAKCQKASSTSKTYQVVGHLFYVYEDSFPLRVYEINRRRSDLPGLFTVFAHYR